MGGAKAMPDPVIHEGRQAPGIAGLVLPGCSRAVTPVGAVLHPTSHDMYWRRPGGAPKTPIPGDRVRNLWTPPQFASRNIIDATGGSNSSASNWGAVSPTSTFSKSQRSLSPGSRTFESLASRLKSPDTARELSALRTKLLFPKRVHHTKSSIKAEREHQDHTNQMVEISSFV